MERQYTVGRADCAYSHKASPELSPSGVEMAKQNDGCEGTGRRSIPKADTKSTGIHDKEVARSESTWSFGIA